MPAPSLDVLVSLCKRRGFIFPSSEIYGGLQGMYDYGPLGVELKNNLKQSWWRSNVFERDDMEGIDASILMNKLVWKYSGHEDTFVDPMVDCRQCQMRWRADHVQGRCPSCGSTNLTEPRPFNMMFKTQVGPVPDPESYAYLRPETAQGIFVNFKNVVDSTSRRLPFGIAQVGKSFRNEITPRNFIFRVREFEQMEIEYFVKPGTDEEWHKRWVEDRLGWWRAMGLSSENLEPHWQAKEELAHYSKATVDILYRFPHGLEELEGIANRTDYDLGSHSREQDSLGLFAKVLPNEHSTARLTIPDPETGKTVVPFVIEPSAGVDRGVLAVLCEGYADEAVKDVPEDKLSPVAAALSGFLKSVERNEKLSAEKKATLLERGEELVKALRERLPLISHLLSLPGADEIELGKKLRGQAERVENDYYRTVLRIKPHLSPIKVAVLPLKRNHPQIVETAKSIKNQLQAGGEMRVVFEDTNNIGKGYRRHDEVGTPFCVTVDFDTLGQGQGQGSEALKNTVTVRERDSMKQERVPVSELEAYLRPRLQKK